MPASCFRIGFLIAAAVAADAALAQPAQAPEPGLWSIATRLGHGGREVPLRKVERCIAPDEASKFGTWTSVEWTGKETACKSTNLRKTDNGGVLQVHCAGRTDFDATATFTLFSPRHYTIVFAATPPAKEGATKLTRTIEGRRLGDCTK